MLDYTPVSMPTRKALKYTAEERQKWRTPNTPDQPVLQLVATALGGEIGIDVTADAARSVPAHHHITAEMDCRNILSWPNKTIKLTAFMNPEFNAPHIYLDMLIRSMRPEFGIVDEAIALMKAGTVHNKKTGELIRQNASVICHWGAGKVGRMGFIDHEGYQINGSDFDVVLVYLGENEDRFNDVFRHWGTITRVLCWDA
jgi:hypothetical protein